MGVKLKDFIAIIFGSIGLIISLYNLWRTIALDVKARNLDLSRRRQELMNLIIKAEASCLKSQKILRSLQYDAVTEQKDNDTYELARDRVDSLDRQIASLQNARQELKKELPSKRSEQDRLSAFLDKTMLNIIENTSDLDELHASRVSDETRFGWRIKKIAEISTDNSKQGALRE